ncbi:thioredoxin domain-containing protein [Persephonella sp.]|uniref:thioredoxin domain-containing protein n=1 Tax=Persephonella sp. TaxID=2060922 RepID=UPI002624C36F|nr:thioredoxin domain-containing protein [Persephonella sp.]
MPNRLINEKSPYLRQHAYNPVDWYPWGEEAFEKAKKEDKPIFLSIGYSTCHWCHVMEKESFEDEEIAEILNKYFVSIKVDREERPDVDSIYMNVCMMMTGRGGWPLTIFMTPDKKPFYAGTYFPKEGSHTRIGLKELLLNIAKLWQEDRTKLLERADKILNHLKEYSKTTSEDIVPPNISEILYETLKDMFDPYYGGFGRRPKFPVPHNLMFLMRYYSKTKLQSAIDMIKHTLTEMRLGGIYDHIGYGLHRYSTDERWFLPHFEKMLYDQAMLMIAYTEAFQITGEKLYKETVQQIAEYLQRDMLSPEGGFYSAEDADSEGEEGKFYVWSYEEIEKIIGKEDIKLFEKVFNITPEGNYREEHTGRLTGKNILYLKKTIPELAKELGISENQLKEKIIIWREKLFTEREKRVHPLKDTKILTDWNGLIIAALSKASVIDPEYAQLAKNVADFVLKTMKKSDGTLLHRYKDGEAEIDGFLSDYAFLVWGLIELYQATAEEKYLIEAINLTETMIKHFWDEKGGFFDTPDFGENLIVKPKESYDGAIPSGNSVAVYNLYRLFRMTGDFRYRDYADKTIEAFSSKIKSIPAGYSMMILGYDFGNNKGKDIVIAGKDYKEVLEKINQKFMPYSSVLVKKGDILDEKIPFLKQLPVDDKPAVYICEDFTCGLPITDISQLDEKLG